MVESCIAEADMQSGRSAIMRSVGVTSHVASTRCRSGDVGHVMWSIDWWYPAGFLWED